MPFIVSGSNSTHTPAPAGTHVARCIWMLDLGTQTDNFQGRDTVARKMILGFELPNETHVYRQEDGEQPFIVSREFRTSLHKKASLRVFLEGWRGRAFTDEELKGFDLSVLAGKECMVSVIHKTSGSGKLRAEITNASRIMKGSVCPASVLPVRLFSLNDETFNIDTFNRLPEWIQDKITKSPEYRELACSTPSHSVAPDMTEDDLPF